MICDYKMQSLNRLLLQEVVQALLYRDFRYAENLYGF